MALASLCGTYSYKPLESLANLLVNCSVPLENSELLPCICNCSDWGKLGSGEDGVQGLVGVAAAQAPGAEQGSQHALGVAPLG